MGSQGYKGDRGRDAAAPGRRAAALAIASGLLLAASQEPVGLGPLGFIALLPLFIALHRTANARRAALLGWLAAAVYFGLHLYWIFHFGWMAWTGLTAVLALYVAVAAAFAKRVIGLPLGPALVAGAWAALELVRDRWPWGGYSWGSLGTSQGGVPGVRWLAGTVGVYGLSFVLAFVSAAIAHRVVTGRIPWSSVAAVAVALGAFVALDAVTWRPAPGKPVRIAVVQGSVPRPERVDQFERVFASHVRLTRTIRPGTADLVVWPESSIGFLEGPDVDSTVADLARSLRAPMLVGRSRALPGREEFVNAVQQIDPDGGQPVRTYAKRHPVPFGERVPVPALRRFVSTLDQVPYDMARGRRAVVFDVGGVRVGTPICFESVFPRDVLDFTRKGAELIVVSTNDSSFERSFASRQHLAHARMRALETRQWYVQAALSGISAVVSPSGRVSHRTALFRPAIVRATVRARPATSLYSRTGDLFAALWAAAALVALLRRSRRVR